MNRDSASYKNELLSTLLQPNRITKIAFSFHDVRK